jgi:hypothetical protein
VRLNGNFHPRLGQHQFAGPVLPSIASMRKYLPSGIDTWEDSRQIHLRLWLA